MNCNISNAVYFILCVFCSKQRDCLQYSQLLHECVLFITQINDEKIDYLSICGKKEAEVFVRERTVRYLWVYFLKPPKGEVECEISFLSSKAIEKY